MTSESMSIENLILSFLKGELSSNEKVILDEWISQSPENKQLFDELTNGDSIVQKLMVLHDMETSPRKRENQASLESTLFSSSSKIIRRSSQF